MARDILGLGALEEKIFVGGEVYKVSSSPISETSVLYTTILSESFYITKLSAGTLLFDDNIISKVNESIFYHFGSSTGKISNIVENISVDNLEAFKSALESDISVDILSVSDDVVVSSNPQLVNFNHDIQKITLHDRGRTNITIAFQSPDQINRIYFLQLPNIDTAEEYDQRAGFSSMIKNNLMGLKCDSFSSFLVSGGAREQNFNIDVSDGDSVSFLIGLSSTTGYVVVKKEIIGGLEYLIPVEDLRDLGGKIDFNKKYKAVPLSNNPGQTSYDAGHDHSFFVDEAGNGVTSDAASPENINIRHSHEIINYIVHVNQSNCYPNCKDAFGAAGVAPHSHKISPAVADSPQVVQFAALPPVQPIQSVQTATEAARPTTTRPESMPISALESKLSPESIVASLMGADTGY